MIFTNLKELHGYHSTYWPNPTLNLDRWKNSKFLFSLQSATVGQYGEWVWWLQTILHTVQILLEFSYMTWSCILPIDLWRYDPPPQRSLHNVYRAPRFPSSTSHWRLGDGCEIAIQSSTIMSTSVVDYAGAGVKNYDTNGTSRWRLRIMQNPEGEEEEA